MAACCGLPVQTVWNVLAGRPRGTGIRDYDLVYFDEDLSWAAEDAVIRRVAAAIRGCVGPVETRNLIEEVRFAMDSPLEGDGFEHSVPRQRTLFETGPFELAR